VRRRGRSGRRRGFRRHGSRAAGRAGPILHQPNLRPVAFDLDLGEVVLVHQPYERAHVVKANGDRALPAAGAVFCASRLPVRAIDRGSVSASPLPLNRGLNQSGGFRFHSGTTWKPAWMK